MVLLSRGNAASSSTTTTTVQKKRTKERTYTALVCGLLLLAILWSDLRYVHLLGSLPFSAETAAVRHAGHDAAPALPDTAPAGPRGPVQKNFAHQPPPREPRPNKPHGEPGHGTALLRPPFRIVQIGEPRSGSTFQFQLLTAIARLKSPPGTDLQSYFVKPDATKFADALQTTQPFVLKIHKEFGSLRDLQRRGDITVFSSTYNETMPSYATYVQKREELVRCSLCEIDRYRPLFGLTDPEVAVVTEYMELYEKIRQCCGMQMSKYEVLRLNGCDMAEFRHAPDYPQCETYDLPDVERRFAANPVPYYEKNTGVNWAKPGDCARFGKTIAAGKGFNFRPFDGCRLNGMFAGKGNSDGSFVWEENKHPRKRSKHGGAAAAKWKTEKGTPSAGAAAARGAAVAKWKTKQGTQSGGAAAARRKTGKKQK